MMKGIFVKHLLLWALPVWAVISCGLSMQAQQPASSYKLLKKFDIGGEGSWDYLTIDAEARRLYITRGSHVMVMDVDNGKVVGDIPNTMGVHGVVLAPS